MATLATSYASATVAISAAVTAAAVSAAATSGTASTIAVFLQGFAVGAGLIIAIGAQNAFVLAQGLKRQHAFTVATIGFVADATLVTIGAAGVGTVIAANPTWTTIAAIGGAGFLIVYGLLAFRSALRPQTLEARSEAGSRRWDAVATMLAVTLLNPHVYLDTVILVGSIAGQYAIDARAVFAAGAVTASCVWFYGLAFGARALAPVFANARAWQAMDVTIGIVMWSIAASLLAGVLR